MKNNFNIFINTNKTTKDNYDDFQIILPNRMKDIAKAYQISLKDKELNLESINKTLNKKIDKPSIKDEELNNKIFEIKKILNHIYINFDSLKKICSKRYYSKKEQEINNILMLLNDTIKIINKNTHCICKNENADFLKRSNNYCSCIKDSINLISIVSIKLFSLYSETTEKYLIEIHYRLNKLIKNATNLLGECKYRSLY